MTNTLNEKILTQSYRYNLPHRYDNTDNKFTLNEKILTQLYRYNLPYRYDNTDNKFIIDVPVKETINGDLFYTCPFVLTAVKKHTTIQEL